MRSRAARILFLLFQVYWTCVVLPGHVRGMIVEGGCPDCAAATKVAKLPACCRNEGRRDDKPGEERQSRCAICNNAHGYVPAVAYTFYLPPAGLLEMQRLIEPTRLHLLLCRPTYFATAPPACLV